MHWFTDSSGHKARHIYEPEEKLIDSLALGDIGTGRDWHGFSSRCSGYQTLYRTSGKPINDEQTDV